MLSKDQNELFVAGWPWNDDGRADPPVLDSCACGAGVAAGRGCRCGCASCARIWLRSATARAASVWSGPTAPTGWAPLFFGRNEECGLRCPYHGWKFDVEGHCVEAPNVAPGTPDMRRNVGDPCLYNHEAAGAIWVYMGPLQMKPPFPALECTQVPTEQCYVSSWLQAFELVARDGGRS